MDDFIPDDLSNDDDFVPDSPKDQGKIENTENLLQKAIKSASDVGGGIMDSTTLGLNRMAARAGTSLAEKVTGTDLPDPQFEQTFSRGVGQAIPLVVGGAGLVKGIAKGGGKILSNFRKFPVEKEIGKLGEEAKEITYTGAKKVKELIKSKSTSANKAFGEALDNLGDSPLMSADDFSEALIKTAEKLGIRDTNHPIIKKAIQYTNRTGQKFTARQTQMETKGILKYLGNDEVSRATFYRNILEKVPEELKAIKEAHKPIYEVLESGKQITKGGLGRVSKGTAPPSEIKDLLEAEKKFGSDVVGKASQHGSKINKSQNRLQEIIRNQNRVKTTVGTLGGLGAVGGLLKYIFGGGIDK